MPQMAPMNWAVLFILFSSILGAMFVKTHFYK